MLGGKHGGGMRNSDKLKRDIETLLESIKLDWKDVAEGRISKQDAVAHVEWCISELRQLIESADA